MSLKKQSLKFRLILSYSLAAFVLTSFAIIFLYYTLTHLAKTNDYNFLSGELHTIANILTQEKKENNLISDLQQEIILEPKTSNYQYYARILNHKNKVMMATPHINDFATQTIFPTTQKPYNISKLKKINRKKQQLSLMSMQLPYHKGLYTIQVALNSSHTKALISEYQYFLWLLLAINIFLSILIGTIVTKHGLKPINKLNRMLNTLQSDALHLQLDTNSWPIELQQTIKALNCMLERIDSSFNRLKDFSSDIAHELRTPLNNIICQNEVTLGQPRPTDEYINIVAGTVEECRKMAKLIDDMLLIARSKDPYFALKKEQIDLNSLLNNTINYLQIMADEKDITIGITGRGVIEGDPSLLKRAFLNILINSIKYSKHQQQITITISDSEVLNAIQVVIEDSGYGIDSKDLPHIFDRFYRTDHSRSKTIGGTGLGLAIVKSILGLHHADISIKSQLSVGTRIEIIFPK